MMTNGVSTLQRAFQLAKAGACHSVADIRRKLSEEGYENVDGHLHGATIQRQLRDSLAARGVKVMAGDDDEL